MRTIERIVTLFVAVLFMGAAFAFAQGSPDPGAPREPGEKPGTPYFGKKEKKAENSRSVAGVVENDKGELVEGAVVKLKDTKTLEVRSFITQDDGRYRFHGLSTENDYELRASHEGQESKARRLSVYDSRKKATINLKLKPEA